MIFISNAILLNLHLRETCILSLHLTILTSFLTFCDKKLELGDTSSELQNTKLIILSKNLELWDLNLEFLLFLHIIMSLFLTIKNCELNGKYFLK